MKKLNAMLTPLIVNNKILNGMKYFLYLFGLLTVASPAQAASFDCAKAQSKVEHLICDNPELSKLDEDLSTAYKAAMKDRAKAKQIKQEQQIWIRQRDSCDDVSCVKNIFGIRLSALNRVVITASESNTKYLMIHGKNEVLCEQVFKQMNEGPPLCARDLLATIPGVVLPKWKKLDWQENKLLYKRFLVAQMIKEKYYPRLFGGANGESDAVPLPSKEQMTKSGRYVLWDGSDTPITDERLEQEWDRAVKYGNEFYRWVGAMQTPDETDVILVETRMRMNHEGCPTVRMMRFSKDMRIPKPWLLRNSEWFITPGQFSFKFDDRAYSVYEEDGLSRDDEGMLTIPFKTLTIDSSRHGHYCFIQTNYSSQTK